MRRVVLACGVVGGVWGLLAPILVVVPIRGSSLLEMGGIVSEVLPWLSFIAVLGTLGLVGLRLHTRSHKLGKPFLWTSAVAMLLVSLLLIFSLGLFFLPASVLLLVAAIGLKRKSKRGNHPSISIFPFPLLRGRGQMGMGLIKIG